MRNDELGMLVWRQQSHLLLELRHDLLLLFRQVRDRCTASEFHNSGLLLLLTHSIQLADGLGLSDGLGLRNRLGFLTIPDRLY